MATSRVDQVAEAAMKVQALRDQLVTAEAELEAAKSAAAAEARAPVPMRRSAEPRTNGEKTLRDRVRDLMADGTQRTTGEVAASLDEEQSRVGDSMKRLAELEELRRVSTGVYILAAKVQSRRSPAKGTRPPTRESGEARRRS